MMNTTESHGLTNILHKWIICMVISSPAVHVSCLLVMADLRGSDCLSVGECGAVFQDHTEWERRLVEKAAVKESDIVEKIASIMARHFPSSEEARKLKGIFKTA